jgi:hypothetical protein
MNGIALWNAIRHRLGLPALRQHRVTVQHLMLAEPDLRSVQAALDPVGRRLGVQFVLQGHAGDIVLLDADLSGRISPQLVHALVEDRPTVLLGSLQRPEVAALDATQQQALREQELQRQLLGIGLVRRHSAKPDAAHWHRSGLHAVPAQTGAPQARPVVAADSDFDPTFDSRIDAQQLAAATLQAEQTALLAQVQRGLGDPDTPALAPATGPTRTCTSTSPRAWCASTRWPCNTCGCAATCRCRPLACGQMPIRHTTSCRTWCGRWDWPAATWR